MTHTIDYDVDEILIEGLEALTNLSKTLDDIEEPEKKFRFQKWLFPEGLTYGGENLEPQKFHSF